MISIDTLMGIICTEAIEDNTTNNDNLPPIRYDLELIEEYGYLVWKE